ncbi:MAG: hypothetical protein RIF37_15315 [Rhodospirillaceae bacterium]
MISHVRTFAIVSTIVCTCYSPLAVALCEPARNIPGYNGKYEDGILQILIKTRDGFFPNGTAVTIDKRGFFITAAHVVDEYPPKSLFAAFYGDPGVDSDDYILPVKPFVPLPLQDTPGWEQLDFRILKLDTDRNSQPETFHISQLTAVPLMLQPQQNMESGKLIGFPLPVEDDLKFGANPVWPTPINLRSNVRTSGTESSVAVNGLEVPQKGHSGSVVVDKHGVAFMTARHRFREEIVDDLKTVILSIVEAEGPIPTNSMINENDRNSILNRVSQRMLELADERNLFFGELFSRESIRKQLLELPRRPLISELEKMASTGRPMTQGMYSQLLDASEEFTAIDTLQLLDIVERDIGSLISNTIEQFSDSYTQDMTVKYLDLAQKIDAQYCGRTAAGLLANYVIQLARQNRNDQAQEEEPEISEEEDSELETNLSTYRSKDGNVQRVSQSIAYPFFPDNFEVDSDQPFWFVDELDAARIGRSLLREFRQLPIKARQTETAKNTLDSSVLFLRNAAEAIVKGRSEKIDYSDIYKAYLFTDLAFAENELRKISGAGPDRAWVALTKVQEFGITPSAATLLSEIALEYGDRMLAAEFDRIATSLLQDVRGHSEITRILEKRAQDLGASNQPMTVSADEITKNVINEIERWKFEQRVFTDNPNTNQKVVSTFVGAAIEPAATRPALVTGFGNTEDEL